MCAYQFARRKETVQVLASNAKLIGGSRGRRAGHLSSKLKLGEGRSVCRAFRFWLFAVVVAVAIRSCHMTMDEMVGLEDFDGRREAAIHYATTYYISRRIFRATNYKNLALPVVVNYREKKADGVLRLCAHRERWTWEAPTRTSWHGTSAPHVQRTLSLSLTLNPCNLV